MISWRRPERTDALLLARCSYAARLGVLGGRGAGACDRFWGELEAGFGGGLLGWSCGRSAEPLVGRAALEHSAPGTTSRPAPVSVVRVGAGRRDGPVLEGWCRWGRRERAGKRGLTEHDGIAMNPQHERSRHA